jgi:hypothetical protein
MISYMEETKVEGLPTMDRATEINRLYDEFCGSLRTTREKAIRIGELLIDQQAECGSRKFAPWLKANVKFSRKTAYRFINAYNNRENPTEILRELYGEAICVTVTQIDQEQKIERFKDPLQIYNGPPKPTEDQKKFEAARRTQDQSPLSDEDRKEILAMLNASWRSIEYGYNDRQLGEVIQMYIDFWGQKKNEVIQRKFRIVGN